MSSPLAIATVTAVLKDLLNDGLVNSDLSASVGTRHRVARCRPTGSPPATQEPSQLNLFLYQVTPNPGWRNADLPSRDGGGARVTSPPLALDLHYLLTAYGADDLDAEILLGYAMQLLHERPVLTAALIRKTFSVTSPVTDKLMPASRARPQPGRPRRPGRAVQDRAEVPDAPRSCPGCGRPCRRATGRRWRTTSRWCSSSRPRRRGRASRCARPVADASRRSPGR